MNETQGKGGKKTWVIILAVLVLVLTASNVITYINLQNVQQQYNDLSSLYSNLKSNYNELSNSYSSLKSSYDKLSQDYQDLQLQYSSLKSNYYTLSSYYKGLSQNVLSLYNLFQSYISLEQAFSRTLNEEAVNKVSFTVSSVTRGSTSFWPSIEKIYYYVASSIKYTNDVDMLYISSYKYVNIDRFDYIASFETSTVRNYVQTPELTLEIKQGDCEDQAILTYAMIRYYMKHIIGTEYLLYIALIDFSDGSGHTAVFLPAQGGQVCIIDPAGSYLTKTEWGEITAKSAQFELNAYSNNWSSHGSISSIKLYDVSIIDGSYKVVAEGDLNQITAFLSKS
jgi:uncharacterized membrane-anchored protein YhcB (DUF1043 family)